jgi:hypothetical protein
MKQIWFSKTWCKPSWPSTNHGDNFCKLDATMFDNNNGDPHFDPKLAYNNEIAYDDD